MKPGDRIDAMFAFVVVDSNDDIEGVTSFHTPDMGNMPMVGADFDRAKSLVPVAEMIASAIGKPVELVRFTNREHVQWVKPQ